LGHRANLWDELCASGAAGTSIRFLDAGGEYVEWPWEDCVREAERVAAGLRERGIRRGSRVACVLTNSAAVCTGLFGIWLAGGTVVSLPTPSRGTTAERYATDLARLCAHVGSEVLLLESRFAQFVPSDLASAVTIHTFEELPVHRSVGFEPPEMDEVAFIQYSSGSTAAPKGCMLTGAAIMAQLERLREALGIDRSDRGLMWLPLSHDMGLFGGMLTAWTGGMDGAIGTPERFVASPRTWFDDLADFGATFTVSPNFALGLAARAARRMPPKGRSPLRACILGAERLDWGTLTEAARVLGPYGLKLDTLTPAYGLAEATLAVTAMPPEEPPRSLDVDLEEALAGRLVPRDEEHAGSTRLVCLGRPLRDVEVGIADGADVGEVTVASPALARGYVNDEQRTAERFHDGRFHTGDVGFVHEGEVYLLGRTDDMLSIGGTNVHAGELEAMLTRHPVLRAGSCALVDDPRSGALVLLAEPTSEEAEFDSVARDLNSHSILRFGVPIDDFVFVRRGTLPKTPSGKVQRFRCRQLISADALASVAQVSPRRGAPVHD
jgi:acyl-CoA synthetase (AMP-forming)/AMP-acid ligase II